MGAPLARADEALTLKECYQMALERSETVAMQGQVIKEAEGRFLQNLSTSLPKIAFVDTEKKQDTGSSSARTYFPERVFVFTQPLFTGFKEFAGIAASKAEHKQREQELLRAQQLLFTDVSDAFYLLKSYQEDLKAVEEIHKALQDRMDELKKRESLGRSRTSEVAGTEAKLYQNEAELESVRGQQEIASELMAFLIGSEAPVLADADLIVGDAASENDCVNKADARPDVKAAQHAAVVAEKKIAIARSGFFPTVNAVANSYTKRVGADNGVDWDITLNVDVPIFNGTQTFGEVKEAQAQAEEAKLRSSQVQRQAVLDIRNAYTKLTTNQRQTKAFKRAVDAAQRNYDLQAADYRNNLVNNLDVLQALQDLQTMRRSYISIKNETQRAYWNLKVATGDIVDDTL